MTSCFVDQAKWSVSNREQSRKANRAIENALHCLNQKFLDLCRLTVVNLKSATKVEIKSTNRSPKPEYARKPARDSMIRSQLLVMRLDDYLCKFVLVCIRASTFPTKLWIVRGRTNPTAGLCGWCGSYDTFGSLIVAPTPPHSSLASSAVSVNGESF